MDQADNREEGELSEEGELPEEADIAAAPEPEVQPMPQLLRTTAAGASAEVPGRSLILCCFCSPT